MSGKYKMTLSVTCACGKNESWEVDPSRFDSKYFRKPGWVIPEYMIFPPECEECSLKKSS